MPTTPKRLKAVTVALRAVVHRPVKDRKHGEVIDVSFREPTLAELEAEIARRKASKRK